MKIDNISGEAVAIHSASYDHDMTEQGHRVSDNVQLFGMSQSEYDLHWEDCQESISACEDIQYYLTNTPDVANYLF